MDAGPRERRREDGERGHHRHRRRRRRHGGDGQSHSKRRRPEREGKEGEPSTSSRVVDEAALRAQVDARVADMVAGHPEVGDDLAFIVTNLQKGQGKIDPSSVPDEDLRSKLEALFAILVNHKIVSCDVKGRYSRGAESSHLSMIIAALEATRRSEATAREEAGEGEPAGPAEKPPEPSPPAPRRKQGPIGPAMPPRVSGPSRAPIGPAMPPGTAGPHAPIGPTMMPPPSRAAADLEDLFEDEDDFVGPTPLAAGGAQLGSAQEEIERILRAANAGSGQVLGIDEDATTKQVVKRYLKLSLLIHPDKCSLPSASKAFTLLNKAKQDQLDSSKKDDAQLWEMALAEARRRQQSADWKSIRTTGSIAKPKAPLQREDWMTNSNLPTKARAPQQNVTRFSR